jgi:hypothetical protein
MRCTELKTYVTFSHETLNVGVPRVCSVSTLELNMQFPLHDKLGQPIVNGDLGGSVEEHHIRCIAGELKS